MLLSQTEIEVMKSLYPDEKPIAFNFMQAREDFLRLAKAYTTLINGSCGLTLDNLTCQSDKKKFIVLIDSSYVRDAQIFPGDYFINEGDSLGDYDSAWEDYEASILLGEYTACCAEQAIMLAADSKSINPRKLVAYQIIEYRRFHMRKKDLLCKQECIWLRDLIDKEIAVVTEAFIESNGHPILKLRLENLEAMKIKLNNQINHYLGKQ